MAFIEIEDGESILIETEYRERELVKTIPGARWIQKHQRWRLPLSWAACVQARGTFGDNLQIGPELNAWATDEVNNRIQPCLALRSATDADGIIERKTAKGFELFKYQRAGVAFLAQAGSAICADEMGVGKSVQAIMTLEELDRRGEMAYPALIVCPNSMKKTWEAEFAEWAPSRTVAVIGGTATQRRKAIASGADVLVINWEALKNHTRLAGYGYIKLSDKEKEEKELNAIDFSTVIADEAHRAKNPQAKQTRALWAVGDKAQHRYALTGTPLANSPEDLWSVGRFVAPDEWPSKTKFLDRYGLSSWTTFGFSKTIGLRAENRDELFKILDPRFIRRPKEAVLPDLPPVIEQVRRVEMGTKQKKAYKDLKKHLIAEIDGGTMIAINPLTRLTRLVQFAAAYAELGDPTPEGKDVITLKEPSCKVDAAVDIAGEVGEKQCLFFAESRQLIDITAARLEKEGYSVAKIVGGMTDDERWAAMSAFQAGQTQFMLLTFGAGGEGITLTAASVAVYLQRSFSMVKNEQSEARFDRIGQLADHIEMIDVITEDTVEDRIHEVGDDKYRMLQEVTRDEEAMRAWLSE